ncbi:hypothetical protein [Pseudomonas fulva]|uniref:hypothetical protein n=1 Tax=Pseudomonas fulva TaxID=47880 RepID=UPI0032EABBA0
MFKKIEPYPGLCVGFAGVLFMIGALAPSLTDWFMMLKPISDSPSQWFERSGAITTIFGLLAINVVDSGVAQLVPTGQSADPKNLHHYEIFKFSFRIIKSLSFLATIAGTFIWGYGTVILTALGRTA